MDYTSKNKYTSMFACFYNNYCHWMLWTDEKEIPLVYLLRLVRLLVYFLRLLLSLLLLFGTLC